MNAAPLTVQRKILASHMLPAIARGMCNIVYTKQAHEDYVFYERLEEYDYAYEKQQQALKGALCAHFNMSSYERITASLEIWGIISNHAPEIFRMQVDADDVQGLVLNKCEFSDELFSEAIEAFMNFDFQPGWPNNHFAKSLLFEFRDAGLIEGENGELWWSADMLQYFDYVLAVPWDTENFFERICA